jgi:hypothetical protein
MSARQFVIGQIFQEIYPPRLARWCELNNARMVKHGLNGWIVEQIPQPTGEERDMLKREELSLALANADWMSMSEHDRKAADPTYEIDPIVFSYKQFLRDFDAEVKHWNTTSVPSFDEYVEWYETEQYAKNLENNVEEK